MEFFILGLVAVVVLIVAVVIGTTSPLRGFNPNEVQQLQPTVPIGTGGAAATPGGFINSQVSIAGVGNGADTTDDVLFTYSMPANTFNQTAHGVRIRAWGVSAANGQNKTAKIFFGGTTCISTGVVTINAKGWYLEATVLRSGSNTQLSFGGGVSDATQLSINKQAPSETETGAIVIKVTGASGTSGSANDLLGHGMTVEAL